MLIDYRRRLSPDEVKHLDACKDALTSVEPQVRELLEDHRRNSRRWYPHEVLPWGRGQDYREVPWSKEHSPLRPECVIAVETNLLTEDNLPYYHSHLERFLDHSGVWKEWNRLWTAEEAKHGETLRDYLYLLRVMDPVQIEDHRYGIMEQGWDRAFGDPLELFAYTAAQELATRISHLRTGQRCDEEVALKLLTHIARDENFHFVFYRGVCRAVLQVAPDLMLPAIMKQLYSFEMPGAGMDSFELRQLTIANAGIYGVREHRDQVVLPLLKFWDIDGLTDLSPAAAKAQERILKLEKVLTRMVEKQERTPKKSE